MQNFVKPEKFEFAKKVYEINLFLYNYLSNKISTSV